MRIPPPKATGAKINVTPMIDVVMCLIIFFLIVAQLASDRLSRVDLPATSVGFESEVRQPLVINVLPSDSGVRIVVEGKDLDMPALEALLVQVAIAKGQGSIRLRADRQIPYGQVRPVIDACRRAGIHSISLAAEASP